MEKVYDPKNEEDDMMEMEEERLRMREYFMKNVSLLQFSRLASFSFVWCNFASFWLKVDVNEDRLVTLEEFLKSTEKKDFNNPKEWEVKAPEVSGFNIDQVKCSTGDFFVCLETLDMKQVYTEEELQRFEAELRDKEEELRRKKEKLQEEQDLLQERGRALEAQRREYQQVTRMKYSFIHAVSPWKRDDGEFPCSPPSELQTLI